MRKGVSEKAGGIVVIKIGSSSLVSKSGKIRIDVIRSIARQSDILMRRGYAALIVTSGAVACAKNGRSKNLRAAIGQIRLMNAYIEEFEKYGIEVAQALLTDREIHSANAEQIRMFFHEAFREKVVCIVNANDVIDNDELNALEICADNDRLFGVLSEMLGAKFTVIAFNEPGFMDNSGNLIEQVSCRELKHYLRHAKGGNELGHGKCGMETKIRVLSSLASKGIAASLACVNEEDFILRAISREAGFGTQFVP